MPKNKGKGGKNRRRGKNENEDTKRDLVLKDDGQSYAQVTRILGNGYVEAFCFDSVGGKKRLCHIRGKLRKKQWINQGDVILVGLRDYQDDKADVIMKYLADEARELKRIHEIPDNINITETSVNANERLDDVIFDERYNGKESDNDEKSLPVNNLNRMPINDTPSEEESDDDEDQDGSHSFYNPNRIPKGSGNLNAHHLLGIKKDSAKSTQNKHRQAIPGSDSDGSDELAHI